MEQLALRVLVAGSQPDRQVVRQALGRHYASLQLDEAELVDDALFALTTTRYDAVVLCYGLPDRTAPEALPALVAAAPRSAFIVIASLDDEDVAAASLHLGASEYVIKSRNLAPRLAIALDRSLQAQRLRREVAEREQAEQRLLAQQGELRALATEISLAEERERRRVATQLHDTVVQFLAFAKLKLGMLQQQSVNEEQARTLAEVADLLQEALARSRAVMYELSSSALYEIGFEEAVKALVRQYREQYSLPLTFHDDRQPKPLGMDLQIVLFQSLRDVLVNMLERDKVTEAQVRLSREGDQVAVTVCDNGEPREPVEPALEEDRLRLEMLSIRERLRHFGGQLIITTAPGKGTTATLLAPV